MGAYSSCGPVCRALPATRACPAAVPLAGLSISRHRVRWSLAVRRARKAWRVARATGDQGHPAPGSWPRPRAVRRRSPDASSCALSRASSTLSRRLAGRRWRLQPRLSRRAARRPRASADAGGAPSGREACATVMFEASPFAHGPIVAAGLGVVIRPDPRRLYAYFRSLGTVVGVGIGPLRRELEALAPDGLVRGLVSLMSWHSPLSTQVTGMSFRPGASPLSRGPRMAPRGPLPWAVPLSGRGARLRRRGPD